MSALILAAQYGHYEIVKILIPRVANINEKASVVTVKKGKSTESGNAYTALHWATNGNYTTIGKCSSRNPIASNSEFAKTNCDPTDKSKALLKNQNFEI